MSKVVGFVGFGEAAYWISKGLIEENSLKIVAFDINISHPELGPKIKNRAEELGVCLANNLEDLIAKSQIVISSTSAKYAVSVAKDALPYLNQNHLYVDINASSPMVKEEIAKLIDNKTKFVDTAVVESIPNYKHKVPLLVSGDGAEEFVKFGNENGMNVTFVNQKPGSASAIKMVRSVFMKGFAMLLLEALSASNAYQVNDFIISSLEKSITSGSLEQISNNLLNRSAIHAKRRIAEMDEVIKTLESVHVDSTLSQAAKSKLELIDNMKTAEHFGFEAPSHYKEVLEYLKLASTIKN